MRRMTLIAFLISIIPSIILAEEAENMAEVSYGVWSLAPALIAIVMALVTRQVLPSLFVGVWVGAWQMEGGSLAATIQGFLRVIDTHILRAIVPEDGSTDHMSIVVFTLVTGGMIGVISKNGGMSGVVSMLAKKANNPKRGQFASLMTSFCVFFDDYANMLIVGNTMRPLMDKVRVSREKLSYLVDTAAAPLASVALVTTWIGFQVSLIDGAKSNIPELSMSGYEMMLHAIPYSFYSVLSLVFIILIISTNRDFGPMWKAECNARSQQIGRTEYSSKSDGEEGKAINAILPIATIVIAVLVGLVITGIPDGGITEETSITDILGNANPFTAMLWASLCSLVVALVVTTLNSPLGFAKAVEAIEEGFLPMLGAIVILTFAWTIADINKEMKTAEYLVSLLGDTLDPHLLPAVIFILASAIAFATGTSWGVMAIMMPLAIPLCWLSVQQAGLPEPLAMSIVYAGIASTLGGAVWGDHCSPISDTTILSAVASGCSHISHVQTQMPYAVTVGLASVLCGLIPVGYGMPFWMGYGLGAILLAGIVFVLGKKVSATSAVKSG